MSLSPASWSHLTEGLPVGGRVMGQHDCGDGNKLVVSRNERGYSAWCFRCSESGWLPGPQLTLAERLEQLRAGAEADAALAAVERPLPANVDIDTWPIEARAWLYKAGLGRWEIGTLGIYYHDATRRVVLPVWADTALHGECLWWQARAVESWRQPKYLSPGGGPGNVIARWGEARAVTLTEDMLSAIRIGMAGGEGLCLFGTHARDIVLAYLSRRAGPVNVWLDPDQPGREAAAKIVHRLKQLGLSCRRIDSERDPKLHSPNQIKEYLCD